MLVCVTVLLLHTATSDWVVDLNLPSKLLEYTIRNDPVLREKCQEGGCPFNEDTLSNGRCWGYEKNCSFEDSYSAEFGFPKCASANKRKRFFDYADFGYVLKRSNIYQICSSSHKEGSRLRCSDDLRYCHGVNIFFHFKSWNATNSKRYRDDIVQPGEVGGNCAELNRELLSKNLNERGYLRSWADELKHFVSVPSFVVNYENCDIIFERSTIVMKLDASVNMYHHFCDFVDVVWWDTFSGGYVDASFGETWKVFSNSKPVELTTLAGHRVCFRNALFPLLARQRFGLYYNMPLVSILMASQKSFEKP
ncbi:unnamed protein product [Angiostrongylus costaricensis]|uniref:Uncharacterized protein n=1 Tax=Angiostrongylus costaricensis TaxID=334426 RepID=A0A0R3PSU0_ANGCS|nr:unnamed protein product [Angiostrongylus costaricensis]